MKSRKSAVWFTRINLELRSTVNGLSVKRLPTVSLPTLRGPHSSPMCSPTAKYRLTSGLRCLWETVCSVESHVPIQEAHCHHSWELVGRVGRHSSCRKKKQKKNLHLICDCWWVQSHCLLYGVMLAGIHQEEKWELSIAIFGRDLSLLWNCLNFSRAVGSPLVMDPNSICRKAKRLAGKQAELCQTQPEIVSEVAKGARLGVKECQYQFRYRRWNCTSHNKYFGKILQQGEWGNNGCALLVHKLPTYASFSVFQPLLTQPVPMLNLTAALGI